MNVAEITMPKSEARRRLSEYRAGLHRRADAEYEAVAVAYKELANGRPLLNRRDAFAGAGFHADLRPRLAIARADDPEVKVEVQREMLLFQTRWSGHWRSRQASGRRVAIAGVEPPFPANIWLREGYALVPLVPPAVKAHHALGGCHVLWEVEQWAEQPRTARPDRDPYLLRHVGGDLWAVLGEWELTEVERGVMSGRHRR